MRNKSFINSKERQRNAVCKDRHFSIEVTHELWVLAVLLSMRMYRNMVPDCNVALSYKFYADKS
jgi:hypothetical protein